MKTETTLHIDKEEEVNIDEIDTMDELVLFTLTTEDGEAITL